MKEVKTKIKTKEVYNESEIGTKGDNSHESNRGGNSDVASDMDKRLGMSLESTKNVDSVSGQTQPRSGHNGHSSNVESVNFQAVPKSGQNGKNRNVENINGQTVSKSGQNGKIRNLENVNGEASSWSGLNGSNLYDKTDFMVLPEAYRTYNGMGNKYNTSTSKILDHPESKDDRKTEERREMNSMKNNVEIVVVDEGQDNDKEKNVSIVDEEQYLEETIPLGSEAQSFEKTLGVETSQLEVPIDKRLKWLLGNLEQHSFGSDLSQNTATSNSSDISVDMLLQERSDDPEEILTSLGFGDVTQVDNPIERIPERFIFDNSQVDGVSINDVLSDNPEFSQFLQAISDQPEGTDNLDLKQANFDAMMAAHGNPNYGNMLSSVMHGMKFLNLLSSAKSLNNLNEKSDEHPSILQNPKNREYLEQQGFYERYRQKPKTAENFKSNRLVKSQSLDASEKRKRFQATKSHNYSSLTNVPEQEEVFDSRKVDSNMYQSFGTSFGTGRTSRSMTSMEMSTDSFDSADSPGYNGRHLSAKSDQYMLDSGIWNTEDSQKSIDEEYLAEFARDSAMHRKSQVKRMMSSDSYNVGDDNDILKSVPLSRTGSLESTLTPSSFHKLETKSSTLKASDSFDDDVDLYSESYLGESQTDFSMKSPKNKSDEIDSIYSNTKNQKEKDNPSLCLMQPESVPRLESVSGWTKFQKRYGVEMSVKVPASKTEADFTNNNCEISRNVENDIPLDGQKDKQTDRPGLGSIGKIESVQSDSSGFAEAEQLMPEPQVIQKVSSLGSSTESDQTFKSSITILPTKSSTPRMGVSSLDNTQSISLDVSGSEEMNGPGNKVDVRRIDVAVGTDDFSEYLHAPAISYHLHERDTEDSGNCSENDKSVILTIELPKNWVNTNPNKTQGKPRVVSHLYKEIGQGQRSYSVELDSHNQDSDESDQVVYRRKNRANIPLIRTSSDGSVPPDYPQLSSTPYGRKQRSIRDSLLSVDPSAKRMLSLPNQMQPPRSSSPTSLSVISDFDPPQSQTYSDIEHYHSEQSLDVSSVSLASKTDSVSSLCNNSLEYYKLVKLVNQPVSFKTGSSGHKSAIQYEPRYSVTKWTQMRKQQQLEEETKLVQHTLQRYKAELNVMESQFLVKTQLAKDDLSYSDREDVQELQFLWAELRKEVLEMEQTLASRLGGIHMGNDNFNPLLALEVVKKMTDLLREQIYQQQMSQENEEIMEITSNTTCWPSGSQQSLDVRHKSSVSDMGSEHSFGNSLTELKETILTEVRQELHDNTQWLHRELQKKERELNALKMELMSSGIKAGTTRKKHFFESDV